MSLVAATAIGLATSPGAQADAEARKSSGAAGSAKGTSGSPGEVVADPLFAEPFIDVDEWREKPVRHRYVHGGFEGTEAKFIIVLPPKEQYQGRFFQPLPPVPLPEDTALGMFGGGENFIGFCLDSGAGAIGSNLGGFSATAQPGSPIDPTISAYRVSAATARYARSMASEMYGKHHTYIYAFGGSGGGYKSIACAQNTDAFDGTVPFMHPCPMSLPNSFAVRVRGLRVLKDKFPQIADAVEPGGGDVNANLTAHERDVLTEITRYGFPIRTWVFYETMGIGALSILYQTVLARDPGYFQDFWTQPGYLGKDQPELFTNARLQHRTRVRHVLMSNDAAAARLQMPGRLSVKDTDPATAWQDLAKDYGGTPLPVGLELEAPPPAGYSLAGVNIRVMTGPSAGKMIVLGGMSGNIALFQFGPGSGSLRTITDAIRPGHEVQLDNSDLLAFETYYRHTLLGTDAYVCNQFRRADRTPLYPQRKNTEAIMAEWVKTAVGSPITGDIHGKMIVLQYLMDWDAHAWFADWYHNKVREHLGERIKDKYRLYFVDHCTHGEAPDPTRTVPYIGALQQALRDLSAWVERGVEPLPETSYHVQDAQVLVPASAAERKGLQSVVSVQANGKQRAEVRAGIPVEFTALIDMPPGAGSIVSAEWDFDATSAVVAGDTNRFPIREQITPAARITLTRHYTFMQPGTYFPALRVHSQRQGNANTPYARVANLGRVRVVVT
jgi:hypothetical protein